MNSNKKKTARNAARVQFLACVDEVVSMLEKGFNNRNVYLYLVNKGIITMAYRSFCWNLQKFSTAKTEKKKPVPPAAPSPKTGFLKPEDVDAKSLF